MNNFRFRFLALGVGLATTACSTMNVPPHIQSVEGDKFSQNITISGVQTFVNPFGGVTRSWFIRSWVDKKTGAVRHQLYVDISYLGEWAFYNTASDDKAKNLEVTKIDSSVGSCELGHCDLYETVGIQLDDKTLRQRAKTGYDIKLLAKSGDWLILTISPEQIQLQLDAVAQNMPHSSTLVGKTPPVAK